MKRLEYFSKVMRVVTELTDVKESDILGKSRVQEIVDARWMVIYLMKEKGYSTQQIVPLMCHPERTINHAYNCFLDKVRYSFNGLGNTLAIAQQQLQG